MRAPAVVLTEIAWRWTFGLAFWAILYYSFREYFASIEISPAEYSLLRSLEPASWIAISARVVVAFITGLHVMGPVIVPAIAILWIALATVGRAASIRALSNSEPRTNWWSMAALHVFRVALATASVLAFFGCGILIHNLIGDPSQNFAAALLLATMSLLLIAFVWSVANWFFSLAAIFSAIGDAGFVGSLSQANHLYRRHTNSFISTGFWFGLIRTIFVIVTTILSLLPIARLSATQARITLLIVIVVSLAYFAIADALNMWRLATYISFTEPEPALPVAAVPSEPKLPASESPAVPEFGPAVISEAPLTPNDPQTENR